LTLNTFIIGPQFVTAILFMRAFMLSLSTFMIAFVSGSTLVRPKRIVFVCIFETIFRCTSLAILVFILDWHFTYQIITTSSKDVKNYDSLPSTLA